MKIFMALGILVLSLTNSPSHHSPVYLQRTTLQKSATKWEPQKRRWKAAEFKSLTLGKSKSTDMLKALGNPVDKEVFRNRDGTIVWYHYNNIEGVQGKVTIQVNQHSKVITNVFVYPDELSKEQAISTFGNNYLITNYEFDTCLGDGDSAPLYESPKGSLKFIEYREKGMSLSLDYREQITYIQYSIGSIGSKWSKCKKRK